MEPDRGHLRALTALTALSGGRGAVTAMTKDLAGWVLAAFDGVTVRTFRLHGVDGTRAAVVAGLVESGATLVIGDVTGSDDDVRVRVVHRAGMVDLVCTTLTPET